MGPHSAADALWAAAHFSSNISRYRVYSAHSWPIARSTYTSPNAPEKRDVLGTTMLSVLAGHKRYAHITALRNDGVLPELLGMKKIVSEDAVRRGFKAIGEVEGREWLQRHLDYCTAPLLSERGFSIWIQRSSRSTAIRKGRSLAIIPRSRTPQPRLPYLHDGGAAAGARR